jgi:hypothetical protein
MRHNRNIEAFVGDVKIKRKLVLHAARVDSGARLNGSFTQVATSSVEVTQPQAKISFALPL